MKRGIVNVEAHCIANNGDFLTLLAESSHGLLSYLPLLAGSRLRQKP